MQTNPTCVVVGAGPGNGLAFGKKFAANDYRVALLARDTDNLKNLKKALPTAYTYSCDVSNSTEVVEVFGQIQENLAPIEVLIYNAGAGVFGSVDDVDADAFEQAWRINTLGCFHCVKAVLEGMRTAKKGTIIIIGATASKRGGAKFTAFTSAKAAQYNFAQSLARHLGPEGIHVAYLIIDGIIDVPRTRQRLKDKSTDFFLNPKHIADAIYHVSQQPPSAWTFELDVRPFSEKW